MYNAERPALSRAPLDGLRADIKVSIMDWTVTHSRYMLTDCWLSVRADSCRTAAGQVVEPYYVFEYPDWVNVVALTDAQEVILVRQYRHGIGKAVLELPSGTIDPQDTSPLEAARRELLEETGYTSQHFHRCGVLSANPATHNNQTHCFLATGCSQVASPRLDESEELEVILKPAGELMQLVRRGELLQSLHVGAVFLALLELGQLQFSGAQP
jgi:ADP-ribose pyrophosphatase